MLSQHSIMEEVAIETALKVIQNSDALAKTICSPVSDNQSWDEILPKLAKTQEDEKGDSSHTEITATTLLPMDGKISLFEPSIPRYQVMVGMLFDLKKCDIQYIFQNNVFSKDWLNKKGGLIPPQITLDQLRIINSDAKKDDIVLRNNEILAGLSKASLVGVFSTKNDLFSRLNALSKQHLIKRALNKMVPVLIITSQDGVSVYDDRQKIRDMKNALSKDKNNPVRILVDNDSGIKQLAVAVNFEAEDVTEDKSDNYSDRYLEKNKNFLTDKNIPDVLKIMVLDCLDFLELAKYAHEIAKGAEDKIIQNLIIKEFNKRIEKDLILLISELSQPINRETVSRIIKIEADDFPLIERAIIHLCYLSSQDAEQVFSDYLFQKSGTNLDIISAFLRYCPVLEIRKWEKTVVFIENDDNPWEYIPNVVVNMKQWSPLVGATLFNNLLIDELIVSRYPKEISDIMAGLNELHKISTDYPRSCDYLLDQITAAKKMLLLQLKQKHSEHYTLTYADKRLIEGHLCSEINYLQSKKSLYAFYQQHADGLYLKQHRHAGYDGMRQKPFPRIKETILTALQAKSMQISNDTDLPLNGEEKEILDTARLKLKSILQAKRDALLKQDKGVIFFLFYSAVRTDGKIKIIDKSLERLDTITHFSELRIFTECLLLNSELTINRSFGIMASDTYLKLKKFYDDCFLVSDNGLSSNKPQVL